MSESIASAIKNWIPYRLFEESGNLCCRWLYLGDEKITEPFFGETIGKCQLLPENSRRIRCVSHADILPEWAQQVETIAPTAFIFHISRCGSTLISQLLCMQPANIVLSEVPFFDELIRHGHRNNGMAASLALLKAAIEMFAAKRNETSANLFIKTDCWHVHFYEQLRTLYPLVPFILLYRRPDEVIRSHQKNRGMHVIPGLIEPEIFGFDKKEIFQAGLDDYMAKVIESYLEAFVKILNKDKNTLAVNYHEGAMIIMNKIAAFTGISISEHEMEMMKRRSVFHGKNPEEVFEEPPLQQSVPSYLAKAFEWYDELERLKESL